MQASKKKAASVDSPAFEKKQERAIATRKALTAAARKIFAGKGFEPASVEEIAAAAGKTRGAFYANFKNKEDVFFAIFEEDISRDLEKFSAHLSAASSAAERMRGLAHHLQEVLKDKPRMMLVLEFKLYAIRHPRRQKRLRDLHASLKVRCMEADLDHLIPEFAGADRNRKRSQSAQIGAVLDGLALNCMFDDGSLDDEQVLRLIETSLHAVLGAQS